jgi:hypothetical protein
VTRRIKTMNHMEHLLEHAFLLKHWNMYWKINLGLHGQSATCLVGCCWMNTRRMRKPCTTDNLYDKEFKMNNKFKSQTSCNICHAWPATKPFKMIYIKNSLLYNHPMMHYAKRFNVIGFMVYKIWFWKAWIHIWVSLV